MKRYGKAIGIVIGLVLLAALAFYIAPRISSMLTAKANDQTAVPTVSNSEGEAIFESFLADFDAASQYTFCAAKAITGVTNSYSNVMYCTVKGDDYVVQTTIDKEIYRQIYVEGEYTLINDTEKTIFQNTQRIDFPDINFEEAVTGKVIGTQGEIINGSQATGVEIYKDGTVYVLYFGQLGELVRFYYIYNNNEITMDFCNFETGEDKGLSFIVPSTYKIDPGSPTI